VTALFRYAGSKAKTCELIFAVMLKRCPNPQRYITPTLGSGADLYFAIESKLAMEYVGSDCNKALITAHSQVAQNPEHVIDRLTQHLAGDSRLNFEYHKAHSEHSDPLAEATRTLFLLACGYNGLWRESKKSGYNVPFGKRFSFDADKIRCCSLLLNSAPVTLTACDFEQTLAQAGSGDLVYIDPPFHMTAAHYQYKWSDDEHRRLYRAARAAKERGASVWISNSNRPEALALYPDAAAYHTIEVKRIVAPKATMRKPTTEVLIEV